MKKILKGIAALGLALVANASFAQSNTVNVNVSGTVAAGCMFPQSSYNAAFGTIPGATVGKMKADITVLCSNAVPYTLGFDWYTTTGVYVSVWDSTYTTEYVNSQVISKTGTGNTDTVSLHLKAVGTGSYCNSLNLGEGCVLHNKKDNLAGTITMTLTY